MDQQGGAMNDYVLYALAGIGALTAICAVGWGLFWCIHEYVIDPWHQKCRHELALENQRFNETVNHLSYLLNKSNLKDTWLEELRKMRNGD